MTDVGMETSAVLEVIDALVDRLPTRERIKALDVQVESGWPTAIKSQRLIYFDDIDGDRTPSGMRAGTKSYDEDLVVKCICEALVLGGTQREADRLALALAGEVQAAIAEEPKLGIETVRGLMVTATRVRLVRATTPKGRLTAAEIDIRVQGRTL